MSNPMLAGLGLKAGDKRFKLPDIKTSDGKAAYAPSASKEKVAEKEAAAREALAAGKDPEEKKLDPSVGLVYNTAAHFWRAAEKDMRLGEGSTKTEWADWAAGNAEYQKQMKASRKAPALTDETKDEDHPTLLKADVERYRGAVEWAKEKRQQEKDEAAKPVEQQKNAATVTASGHPSRIKAPKVDQSVFAEEEEEDPGRKNKAYWKKDDGGGTKKDEAKKGKKDRKQKKGKEEKAASEEKKKSKKTRKPLL